MSDHRSELLEFMQGAHDPLEGAAIVGFAMVVELIMPAGDKGCTVITSDANGYALPWYMRHAFAAVLIDGDEYDEPDDGTTR